MHHCEPGSTSLPAAPLNWSQLRRRHSQHGEQGPLPLRGGVRGAHCGEGAEGVVGVERRLDASEGIAELLDEVLKTG